VSRTVGALWALRIFTRAVPVEHSILAATTTHTWTRPRSKCSRVYFDRKGILGVMRYPSARLILATNNRPRFRDRSMGIWRRMLLLPFR
jgi:hypothetical protein